MKCTGPELIFISNNILSIGLLISVARCYTTMMTILMIAMNGDDDDDGDDGGNGDVHARCYGDG